MSTAVSDPTTVKYERQFDLLDADGDAIVTWSDYQKLVDRFVGSYGISKDDRRARALQAGYQMAWLELLRHSGSDGDRLTKDQFVAASRLAVVDTSRLNVVEGLAHAMFDLIDSNYDNEVDKEEFHTYVTKVWRVDSPEAMEAFVRLDTDGDGCISRSEFIRAQREYYFSNDPDAAGSLLFGTI
ncbi:EF-hand domain-containing protein [Streptomyces sp. SR27]|uniref:EF-hand domain-containing protein n=1 Tax=Streptomyces sp. SR27 TaxID=3076630 RepID=UPI00295C2D85|nr:EF-hand domain-containing protein [Streptomyces sp. SR27]MDV9193095.1 EF-hand domain-containing protein [Streptomyces sp. SR27]